MHRQQLARIVAVERDQIGDLLAFGLGELQALSGLDLETDVAGRRQRDRLSRLEDRGCLAHGDVLSAEWSDRVWLQRRLAFALRQDRRLLEVEVALQAAARLVGDAALAQQIVEEVALGRDQLKP